MSAEGAGEEPLPQAIGSSYQQVSQEGSPRRTRSVKRKSKTPKMADGADDNVAPNQSELDEALQQAKIEAKAKKDQATLEHRIETEEHKQDVQMYASHAKVEKELRDLRTKGFEDIKAALAVQDKDLKKINRNARKASMAKLAFLLILVGCELDLMGFSMAFTSYWALPYVIVKVMLITGPVGYFSAIGAYKAWTETPPSDKDEEQAIELPEGLGIDDDDGLPKSEPFDMKRLAKEPVFLSGYHVLPIARFYLVLKDMDKNDVESLFRANTLSSFTLGTSQLVGFIFQMISGHELTIFIKINIVSFCLNWLITLMYFATNISSVMKAAVGADTMKYNMASFLQKEYSKQMVNLKNHNKRELDLYIKKLNFELDYVIGGGAHVDVSQCTPEQMSQLRRFAYNRLLNEYQNIS